MALMISKDDVAKLADLSRIKISDKEAESLSREIEDVLGYVAQVSEVASSIESKGVVVGSTTNVWRADTYIAESGVFSKDLVDSFPEKDGDLLKVKKIL